MLLMDALSNVSMSYLLQSGGEDGCCLVHTTILNPRRWTRRAHNLDLDPVYPWSSTGHPNQYHSPKDLEGRFESVSQAAGHRPAYEGFNFSHGHHRTLLPGRRTAPNKTLETMNR